MFVNSISTRVRYAETDQMQIVYYGNYAQYFEIGRVESLRELGMAYRKLEEKGIMLPVLKLEVNYKASAKYDDLLTIKTIIKELPGTRITFDHEVLNEEGKLLTTGRVQLVFVNKETGKPCKCPPDLLELFKPFF